MTKKDYENGRILNTANRFQKGAPNPIDAAHVHGKGNYQGDMMLTPYQLQRVKGAGRALHPFVNYWPSNGTHVNIPYDISDTTFNDFERSIIARAFQDYESNTCIR